MAELILSLQENSELGKLSDRIKSALEMLEQLSPEDRERKRHDLANRTPGYLNLQDGYNCDDCFNRGYTYIFTPHEILVPCKCISIRENIRRLRRSGLEKAVRYCNFESFEATEAWQKDIKDDALSYCANLDIKPALWFFVGGAIGSGKTHICTAISAKIMEHEPLIYTLWADESAKLKSSVNVDGEEYETRVTELKDISTLYIDDLFKINRQGQPPTAADVRLAYELINHRYANHKRTLISSERLIDEICDIDEGIGGRIKERAKGYVLNITRDISRDYRLREEGA